MEIVIKNLSKNYGRKAALKNVSVTIHSGMYGLLGRNGHTRLTLHQNHKKIISMLRSASI